MTLKVSCTSLELSRLQEVLSYNPATGTLVWKQTLSPRAVEGSIAGSVTGAGYVTFGLDGKVLKAHRAAWLLYYGELPDSLIDHEDGDGTNNKISNLRLATVVQNAYNQRTPTNNTSGVRGVSFETRSGKWRAMVGVDGKRKCVGRFYSVESAKIAIEAYRTTYHKEYANNEY